jgi:tetratricopeptide (TPR) repeat protein
LPNQPGLDGDHSAGARQRAVFLSYASEDSGPAERICESLRAAGIEMWFDQSELRGGDAWDAAIRQQIKACTLFVPVISGNSRARAEGYFRLEWKLAVDRAGLAYTYIFLADAYRAPIDLLPGMKGAAEKAVALDPELAEAHAYLGFILLGYERDFAAAERELEKALALNPRSADVHLFRGIDQAMRRQAAAAQSALQMAEKIDPLNPFVPFMEMGAAVARGDSAATLKKARQTLEMQPGFSYYTDPLVYAYASLGRWQECVARSEAIQPRAEDNLDYKVAVCYAHVGANARARRILAHIETVAQTRYVDHSNIAEIYAALGENDGAIKALTQAYADRSQPLMVAWLVPEFKPLHDDKRFRALMERIYGGPKRTDAPT